MSEKKSLEEAHKALWEAIAEGNWGDVEHVEDAVRALLLVGLEEAMSKEHTVFTWHELRRRIEALGK